MYSPIRLLSQSQTVATKTKPDYIRHSIFTTLLRQCYIHFLCFTVMFDLYCSQCSMVSKAEINNLDSIFAVAF